MERDFAGSKPSSMSCLFRNIFRILKHFKNFSGIFLMTELINKQNKLVAMAKLQVFIYGCTFLNNFTAIAIEIS
jgi:hypothetical protein